LRRAAALNHPENLTYLISLLDNLNGQDNHPQKHKTALHWAVEKDNKACIKLLIDHGADEHIADANGKIVATILEKQTIATGTSALSQDGQPKPLPLSKGRHSLFHPPEGSQAANKSGQSSKHDVKSKARFVFENK
jgi:ankyrin repeat protein